MSGGSQCAITYNPTDDNYLALALAVLGNMPAKEALKEFGLSPEHDTEYAEDAKIRTLGKISYILNTICGVPRKKVAEMLNSHVSTINDSLRRIGLYRDGRSQKKQQEE
jgi:hypothetical protein